MKNTVVVIKHKIEVSITLLHFLFNNNFLRSLTLWFTATKPAPNSPHTNPISIDAGISAKVD